MKPITYYYIYSTDKDRTLFHRICGTETAAEWWVKHFRERGINAYWSNTPEEGALV